MLVYNVFVFHLLLHLRWVSHHPRIQRHLCAPRCRLEVTRRSECTYQICVLFFFSLFFYQTEYSWCEFVVCVRVIHAVYVCLNLFWFHFMQSIDKNWCRLLKTALGRQEHFLTKQRYWSEFGFCFKLWEEFHSGTACVVRTLTNVFRWILKWMNDVTSSQNKRERSNIGNLLCFWWDFPCPCHAVYENERCENSYWSFAHNQHPKIFISRIGCV